MKTYMPKKGYTHSAAGQTFKIIANGQTMMVDPKFFTNSMLFEMLAGEAHVNFQGKIWSFNKLQKEDGSGLCWIVTLTHNDGTSVDVFIRTQPERAVINHCIWNLN
jgi:hypothetical protein